MIVFPCSACQKPIQVHEPFAGKTVPCPVCGQLTVVPAEVVRASSLTDCLAPAQAEGELGRLGRYRILKVLGHGGMGIVFQAEDQKLKRSVALKLIHKDRLAKPDAVKRFYREIQAAAALNHPNIVRAYDADQCDSVHFLTMEFVKGSDLSRVVKEHGPLPVVEACAYIRQAALGLQHAAERGLVHRDIKPHNLLLARTESGAPIIKILDMGLARLSRAERGEDASSILTRAGLVMGTLDYMAPEQAEDSHTVDIRADLYSLGCTFYFLLTGRVPFPGGDPVTKLMSHRYNQPQPITELRPDVPAEMAVVVARLMAKEPEDRFQTPAELAEALVALALPPQVAIQAQPPAKPLSSRAEEASPFSFQDTSGVTPLQKTPPLSRGRRKVLPKRLLAGIGVSVIGLLLALAFFLRPSDSAKDNGGRQVTNPPKAPLGPSPQPVVDYNAIDPDKLALDPAMPWRPKELIAVVGTQRFDSWHRYVTKVQLSKDGQTLYASSQDGTITIRDADSGRVRQVLEHRVWWDYGSAPFAVSPDERWLVYRNDKDLVVWDLKDNRAVKTLTGAAHDLAFSPDGMCLLAVSGPKLRIIEPAADWKLKHEIDVATRDEYWPGTLAFVAVSRDSKLAAVRFHARSGPRVRSFDIGSGERVGDFQRERNAGRLTFGLNNDELFFAGYNNDGHLIGCFDLKSGAIIRQKPLFNAHGVALSPDGKQLLVGGWTFVRAVNPDDLSEIWRQSTRFYESGSIAYSGDGTRFAVADSNGLLAVHDAKTGAPIAKPPPHYLGYSRLVLLPDGRAFTSGPNAGSRLCDFGTGKDADISLIEGMNSTVPTPDGRQLIVALPKEKRLFIFDLESKLLVRDLETGVQGLMAVPVDAGRKLLLQAHDSIAIADFKSGALEKTFPTPGEAVIGLAVDAAGRRAALTRKDGHVDVFDLQSAKLERRIDLDGPVRWEGMGLEGSARPLFSRDGKWLACGQAQSSYGRGPQNGKVRLWDTASGDERLLVVPKDCRPGFAVDISPGGEELANGGFDGCVHFWEINTGSYRRSIRVGPANGVLLNVAYAPDGRHLVVNSPCGTLMLLRLPQVPSALGKPGPWQSLLDAQLTGWTGADTAPPGAIAVTLEGDEPVLKLRRDGNAAAWVSVKNQWQSHHLRAEFQFPGKTVSWFQVANHWGGGDKAGFVQFQIGSDRKTMRRVVGARFREADLQAGALVPTGAQGQEALKLADVNLEVAGAWNRLDVVRVGDRMACFVNGRFLGAVAEVRDVSDGKEKELGKTFLSLNCGGGEVLFRHIKVRDITALPPELKEVDGKKLEKAP